MRARFDCRRKTVLRVALAGLCVLLAGCGRTPPAVQTVTVTRADGTAARFTAELAVTASQQAQGLMGRQTLAPDHAMLFVFTQDAKLSFWMKNTPIFLDMIFADATGRIVHVHAKARPFDETPITTPVQARYVLEIKGGEAAAQNIKTGDRIDVSNINYIAPIHIANGRVGAGGT